MFPVLDDAPGLPTAWGVTGPEWTRHYPSDGQLAAGWMRMVRAVDCSAAPEAVWPWLCQLRVAPYSYDWLDNGGRRSPRRLTPGITELEVGQDFMGIFRLEEFVPGSRLTLSMNGRRAVRLFGPGWITYCVGAGSHDGSRVVAALALPKKPGPLGSVWNVLLPWGDLLMMRQQLRTFARLAEQSSRDGRQQA